MKNRKIIGLAWEQTFQQAFHECQEYVFIWREGGQSHDIFFLWNKGHLMTIFLLWDLQWIDIWSIVIPYCLQVVFYWHEIILKFFMRQTWVSVRKCTSVKVNPLRFVAFSNCNKTTHKERAGKNCSAFYGSYCHCQCMWWECFKMKKKYNL